MVHLENRLIIRSMNSMSSEDEVEECLEAEAVGDSDESSFESAEEAEECCEDLR